LFSDRTILNVLDHFTSAEFRMDSYITGPEWTEIQQKGGLDPLGMQASAIRLYQQLVPGISNVTLRMRYYGLYVWLSQNFAKRFHNTDLEQWKKSVRRAEALYALIAARSEKQRPGEAAGVAGLRWARRTLASVGRSTTIDFTIAADPESDGTPYLKQAWGAFGAAYESQLRETGILGTADGHEMLVPTEGTGDLLSDAFAKATGETAKIFLAASASGRVSLSKLDAMADLLPSAIETQSRERNQYERTLFADFGIRMIMTLLAGRP
jgi:hypothetical protein